jgi:hypothetical protein
MEILWLKTGVPLTSIDYVAQPDVPVNMMESYKSV